MFELVAYAYSGVHWIINRILTNEEEIIKSVKDPGTFLSGALAGGMARMCVIPYDKGGPKGAALSVKHRMPQLGLLMMFYASPASRLLPDLEKDPFTKMVATLLVAACAGFNMRLLYNPVSRVADEALRTGGRPLQVARILKNKTVLQFWYTGPNLFANALYYGTLLTVFEGLRRFSERNFFPAQRNGWHPRVTRAEVDRKANSFIYMRTVALNFFIGGTSALVASTLCYPYSAHCYLQTVIHDSAICRGLVPTLIKEVPMMAFFFGAFSALQPILAPHHGVRCGFGY